MRKAYIAPDCEYMTFTVDDLIAQACANNVRNMGGHQYDNGTSCNIADPMEVGKTVFATLTNCDGITVDYCYVASTGSTIFAS